MKDSSVQMKVKRLLNIVEKVEVTSKLVTRNVKHYEMIAELEIEKPY